MDLIKAGRAPRLVQDETLATYEPLCNDKVAGIDWERSAEEVHNLIQGLRSPARSLLVPERRKGPFLRVAPGRCRSLRPAGRGHRNGWVGFTVATGMGTIHIDKVRTEAGKQDAAVFAAERGLKRGDRFTAA